MPQSWERHMPSARLENMFVYAKDSSGCDRSCPQHKVMMACHARLPERPAMPMPKLGEMVIINLDAGLRPVSFYPADDVVPVAVLGMGRRWTGGPSCDSDSDDPHAVSRDPFGGQGHKAV